MTDAGATTRGTGGDGITGWESRILAGTAAGALLAGVAIWALFAGDGSTGSAGAPPVTEDARFPDVDTVVVDGPHDIRLLVPSTGGALRFEGVVLATPEAAAFVRDVPDGVPRHAEGVRYAESGWRRVGGRPTMVREGEFRELTVHLRAGDALSGGTFEHAGKGTPPTHAVTTLR